jgi:hypothetical protein
MKRIYCKRLKVNFWYIKIRGQWYCTFTDDLSEAMESYKRRTGIRAKELGR